MSPAILNDLASDLVGPHFGILEQMQRVQPEPDDPPLAVYAGRLANTQAFAELAVPQVVSGAAWNARQAKMACLGEGVERYAAGLPPPGAIVHCRSDELPGQAVTPDQFALFAPKQYRQRQTHFPFMRYTANDAIGWTEATNLSNGRSAWLPAVFVWLPYAVAPGETNIAPGLSTGLACASDWPSAVLSGLCEVIERDALALTWLENTRRRGSHSRSPAQMNRSHKSSTASIVSVCSGACSTSPQIWACPWRVPCWKAIRRSAGSYPPGRPAILIRSAQFKSAGRGGALPNVR